MEKQRPPAKPEAVQGIHFGTVFIFAGIGLICTIAAFWGPYIPDIGENAVAVWQSIATNFGVGVFSAALLLLFEPKFRKVISKTVSKTVTDEVKKDVREAVQADIDQRFASLTDVISSRYDEKLAAQQDLTKDLVSDFTHDRVMKLFREASNLSALASQSMTVHGEADPDDFVRVKFQLRLPNGLPSHDMYTNEPLSPAHEALHVSFLPLQGSQTAEVIWEPEQDFPAVAIDLAEELNFMRIRGMGEKINWEPILGRLEKGLDAAINASMRTEGSLPLNGEVSDFIDGHQDWYLTTEGLYCPEIQFALPYSHFRPKNRRPGSPSATLTEAPPMEAPPGVANETEWNYVFGLAKSQFAWGGSSYF
ncbi:hypothetical protein J2T10_004128 [Paenarthrobacter nicotinovorans]|uniref:Uncharacterized protein n=1 Tax=Paenarthrobacter nicotinovorans TaxID=29320 RepID=A0ABT9TRZ3_PAENI|nr:hypothetical protein [Paenarthrobacter nicotinovorans]MDQ0104453.1 hypothetical protein [Paenarthrobacter nicotinovorans]